MLYFCEVEDLAFRKNTKILDIQTKKYASNNFYSLYKTQELGLSKSFHVIVDKVCYYNYKIDEQIMARVEEW